MGFNVKFLLQQMLPILISNAYCKQILKTEGLFFLLGILPLKSISNNMAMSSQPRASHQLPFPLKLTHCKGHLAATMEATLIVSLVKASNG